MSRIPKIDSIQELAEFWDQHDLTDFEDQFEEVSEPVFDRDSDAALTIRLQPQGIRTLSQIAVSKGLTTDELLREWILVKLESV